MTGSLPRLSPREIAAAGRNVPQRFVCRLALRGIAGSAMELIREDDDTTLVCREIHRLLPGRRLVARVDVAGRCALLKLFLGAHAGRYCRREARGCALLAAAGVATPALLGELRDPGGGQLRGLLFAYLANARPLTAEDDAGVLSAAGQLAHLHQAGARHRDPHLDNFLQTRRSGEVYLIDGDGVRKGARGSLGRHASLENLAALCAQRPPLADAGLADVYRSYALDRGWPVPSRGDDAGVGMLARATRRQRRLRVRRYLRKTQRDCTEYHCERSFRRYFVCLRSAWDDALEAFAGDPDTAFAHAEILKAGNSATVVRARLGDRGCIIKRYNQKSLWHALRRALKPRARFRLAWRNGQRLNFLQIPTARPLALVERRFGPLRGVAYLVMEDLGDLDLATELASAGLARARLDQVVALFRSLRAADLIHGDTKASNFLLGADRVSVIDLDAMREARAGHGKDLRRFLANFDDAPELRRRFEAALASADLNGQA